MESLAYTLLALLFAWCVLLSLGLAVLLAWVLSWAVPAFAAGYGVALALLGLVFGTIWQARAEAGVGLFEWMQSARVQSPWRLWAWLLSVRFGRACSGRSTFIRG